MKFLLILTALCTAGGLASASRDKRSLLDLVPITAQDACDPNIGNATYASDPRDCQIYFLCDHGWPIARRCPTATVWTPSGPHDGVCESPERARNDECGFVYEGIETDNCLTLLCDDGTCLPGGARCDGFAQCADGSDERDCAEMCDPNRCRLPNCRCSGTDIPGGLLPSETPQMVIISFEGGIRLSEYNHLYQQIFKKVNAQRRREPRVNPNGCPIRGTFFVSHDYTDYAVVQSLYHQGHEIAAHSISKRLPSDWWANATLRDWTEEMADERTILRNLAKVNVRDVKGMRTPYLQMGGNTQFKMMQENGFLYDASMPTIQNNPALWPYTLDYLSTQECTVPPCPHSSFPGVWEVPIVDLFDKMGWKCNQVDQCLFPDNKEEALELLMANFARHYVTNRAPMQLILRPRWFYEAHYNLEAMQEFLDMLTDGAQPEVWFVTVEQALQWVMNPTSAANAANFLPWQCPPLTDREPLCDSGLTCVYYNITLHPNDIDHQGERYIETCADACPPFYPYTGSPDGSRPFNTL